MESIGLLVYKVEPIHRSAIFTGKQQSTSRIATAHIAAATALPFLSSRCSDLILHGVYAIEDVTHEFTRERRRIYTFYYKVLRDSLGFWKALKLDGFSESRAPEEACEAELVLQKLTYLIMTPTCLPWVEAAILTNSRGRFPHLI
ncbi:hypothetical protein GGR53DRAFT_362624 [Hypoxylon sp. FL1150]|nr:hypothetical protein GGR53DRAFT_362624 [Hypoxylon sp. FL1150]